MGKVLPGFEHCDSKCVKHFVLDEISQLPLPQDTKESIKAFIERNPTGIEIICKHTLGWDSSMFDAVVTACCGRN